MDIGQVLNEERQRLLGKLNELEQQKRAIDASVAQVQIELGAITAYEAAKGRRPVVQGPLSRRQHGIRGFVLQELRDVPQGMRRSEIMERLGVKGDKVKEQSITNALSNLKRRNAIELVDGFYRARPSGVTE